MGQHKVSDWMTPDPITITSRDTLPDAYWRMIKNKIRRLPVVDDGVLVGIVTMEDLKRAEPTSNIGVNIIRVSDMLAELPIRQIMTPDPFIAGPEDSLLDVATIMLEQRISALPVMDDDSLVGIITESDIFRAFVASEKEQRGE